LIVFLCVAFEELAVKVLCALQFPSNGGKLAISLQQRHRKAPAAANRYVAGIVRHHGDAADVLDYRRHSSHTALTLFTTDCLFLLGCSRERRHVHQVVAAGAGRATTGRDF
jgi:molybdopterin biosynthesis enzyme